MSIDRDVRDPERFIGRCNRCDLATPAMGVASPEAAGQMMAAAGWLNMDADVAFCPRCREARLASCGAERKKQESSADPPGDPLARVVRCDP